MHRPTSSLFLLVCLATLVSPSPFKTTNSCADFTFSACELSETNIVAQNRFTDSPGECQVCIIKVWRSAVWCDLVYSSRTSVV